MGFAEGTSRRQFPSLRFYRWLHRWAAAMLVGLALGLRLHAPEDPVWAAFVPMVFALGLVPLLMSLLPVRPIVSSALCGVSVSMLILVGLIALGEVMCRWVGFDFNRQEATWRRLPPYCRQPKEPTGTVFFRHDGPEVWTGRVISTGITLAGWTLPEAYRHEAEVTVRYDAHGFRDEEDLKDWEIAVAGDSFTELGSVPFEELFTTVLARGTGSRVRNLGVSSTGPFTHLSYLENYGVAPSLRQMLVVFFEGNDVYDLAEELGAIQHHEATGRRPYRVFEKQTSLMTALGGLWGEEGWREPRSLDLIPMFHFHGAHGTEPVTISQLPPGLEELTSIDHARIDRFLSDFQKLGQRKGVKIGLVYMPCKGRVLHGRLEAVEAEREGGRLWEPTRFPEVMAEGCRRRGIEFIDVTPALRLAAQDHGELIYNPILDEHLNTRGSLIVGRTLVEYFAGVRGAR
jgi:hypothetical protein